MSRNGFFWGKHHPVPAVLSGLANSMSPVNLDILSRGANINEEELKADGPKAQKDNVSLF